MYIPCLHQKRSGKTKIESILFRSHPRMHQAVSNQTHLEAQYLCNLSYFQFTSPIIQKQCFFLLMRLLTRKCFLLFSNRLRFLLMQDVRNRPPLSVAFSPLQLRLEAQRQQSCQNNIICHHLMQYSINCNNNIGSFAESFSTVFCYIPVANASLKN